MRIRNIAEFEYHAQRFNDMLSRFAATKAGQAKVPAAVRRDLLDRRGGRLLSANAAARIAFAREAIVATERLATPSRARPACFLTLVPEFGLRRARAGGEQAILLSDGTTREASTSLDDTREELKQWVEEQLDGMSHFGVIEVAYYTRHPRSEIEGPVFSVHAHVVIWDRDKAAIEALKDRVNARHRSLLPNLDAADVRYINVPDGIGSAILYALKPPMQEYGAYLAQPDALDAVWKQQKRDLRPGDAARVAVAFAGVEIDTLCFDGGLGAGLVERIAAAARDRVKQDERREEAEFERLR